MTVLALTGAEIFDGATLHRDHALVVDGAVQTVKTIVPVARLAPETPRLSLADGTIMPGFVDLQVNGGGGVMLNDSPDPETLARIAAAHARLGTRGFLPTLISATPEMTARAIEAVADAVAAGTPGILGLHLEGPHLSVARKGAHDAELIRPMTRADLAALSSAADQLPNLVVTLAPEAVRPQQISELVEAGAVVSLGHSDCSYETARAAFDAGARLATHLFNAMSPFGHRAPGLVGAVLDTGTVSAGVIADGVHVHAASLRVAMAAKAAPGGLFLVSDAMATAGSEIQTFRLGTRIVTRDRGRLTLGDGTLAGADLTMGQAVSFAEDALGIPRATALAMATSVPAGQLKDSRGTGVIAAGTPVSGIILLRPDGEVAPGPLATPGAA